MNRPSSTVRGVMPVCCAMTLVAVAAVRPVCAQVASSAVNDEPPRISRVIAPRLDVEVLDDFLCAYVSPSDHEYVRQLHRDYLRIASRISAEMEAGVADLESDLRSLQEQYDERYLEVSDGAVTDRSIDEVEQATSGLREQIRQLREALHPARKQLIAQANRAHSDRLEQLLATIADEVHDGDPQVLASMQRFVRQRSLLVVRNAHFPDYSAPLDMVQLVHAAAEPGGELEMLARPKHHLIADYGEEAIDGQLAEHRAQCSRILLDFEVQMDSHLRRWVRLLSASYEEEQRMTSKNSAQTPGLHWREWNRPLYEGAAAIADLAELADGFEARRRWEERFWREYTPTLMREMMLDAPFDRWLLDQKPQVDDERMDLARDMYRDFIRKRHELRGTAFRAGMNARMRPGPTADADHPDKIAYIRAVRRIWDHQEDAIAAFDSLLRGTQWEDAWRAYVAKQQHEHPLLYRAPYSTSARP